MILGIFTPMKEVSGTVENYIKAIFSHQQTSQNKGVSTQTLSNAVGVSPGTTTVMVKKLSRFGFVDYKARLGTTLTKTGRKLALQILRKHRIVESFLVGIMRFDWSEVHQEAEVLEHAVSEKIVERMA